MSHRRAEFVLLRQQNSRQGKSLDEMIRDFACCLKYTGLPCSFDKSVAAAMLNKGAVYFCVFVCLLFVSSKSKQKKRKKEKKKKSKRCFANVCNILFFAYLFIFFSCLFVCLFVVVVVVVLLLFFFGGGGEFVFLFFSCFAFFCLRLVRFVLLVLLLPFRITELLLKIP